MYGGISGEGVDNDWNATVNLGFSCHTDQAVVLECLKNAETLSHPVKAWKPSNPLHLAKPSFLATKCTGMCLNALDLPNAIQSSVNFGILCSNEAAITGTSNIISSYTDFLNVVSCHVLNM